MNIIQKHLPFMGRKKKSEQKPHGLFPQKEVRSEIVRLLGGRCSRCGFDDSRALQIDHIDGGGSKEKREAKGSNYKMYADIYEAVKSGSRKYQVLCANCNWIKKHENKEVRGFRGS